MKSNLAKKHKGHNNLSKSLQVLACSALMLNFLWPLNTAYALPSRSDNGNIIGQATIKTEGNIMTINQRSQRVLIDWDSFDVALKEEVNFKQPDTSAIAINRVAGKASQISGNIIANGHVILLNPNGVMFHDGAQIHVNGGFIAAGKIDETELENFVKDTDDLPKSLTFEPCTSIENSGIIRAGDVVLVGNKIINNFEDILGKESKNSTKTAIIGAKEGKVVLTSASAPITFNADKIDTNEVKESHLEEISNIINDGFIFSQKGGKLYANNIINNNQLAMLEEVVIKGCKVKNKGQIFSGTTNISDAMGKFGEGRDKWINVKNGGKIAITTDEFIMTPGSKISADGQNNGGDITIDVSTNANIADATNAFTVHGKISNGHARLIQNGVKTKLSHECLLTRVGKLMTDKLTHTISPAVGAPAAPTTSLAPNAALPAPSTSPILTTLLVNGVQTCLTATGHGAWGSFVTPENVDKCIGKFFTMTTGYFSTKDASQTNVLK